MLRLRVATVGVGAEESVSDTEKLKVPKAVGVPEMVPVTGSRVSPGGRLPLITAQVTGALPPNDCNVAVYVTPTMPGFKLPLTVVIARVAGGAFVPVLAACETTTGVTLFTISCSAAALVTLARNVITPIS